MTYEKTSSTAFTRNIVEAAVGLGVNKSALLENIGITEEDLASPDARVSSVAHVKLINEAVRLTGNDHFGLYAGSKISPDPANMIYYLFMNSPTFGEALQISAKYYHQYSDSMFAKIVQERNEIRVCLGSFEALPTFPRQINEWVLATWVAMGRKFEGDHHAPLKVRFTNPPPKDDSVLKEFFRAPLEFNCAKTELLYPLSAMETPPQNAPGDLALRDIMERHIQIQLERKIKSDSFLKALRDEVASRLASNKFDLPLAAKALGMSGRSLQRRLKGYGTSYRKVVEATQKEAGGEILRDQGLSLGEVTHRLGFASQAAFYRAFHRWHGTTPAEFRRKILTPKTKG